MCGNRNLRRLMFGRLIESRLWVRHVSIAVMRGPRRGWRMTTVLGALLLGAVCTSVVPRPPDRNQPPPTSVPLPAPGHFHIEGRPATASDSLTVSYLDKAGEPLRLTDQFDAGALVRIDRSDFPGELRVLVNDQRCSGSASLHLEHEDPPVGIADDDVGLPIADSAALTEKPLHAIEHENVWREHGTQPVDDEAFGRLAASGGDDRCALGHATVPLHIDTAVDGSRHGIGRNNRQSTRRDRAVSHRYPDGAEHRLASVRPLRILTQGPQDGSRHQPPPAPASSWHQARTSLNVISYFKNSIAGIIPSARLIRWSSWSAIITPRTTWDGSASSSST
jgi:hypothetical protein